MHKLLNKHDSPLHFGNLTSLQNNFYERYATKKKNEGENDELLARDRLV